MRIVSLLPSATEIVCLFGLREQLVGVSHECDYPASVRELPRVTRSKLADVSTSVEVDSYVRDAMAEERSLYSIDQAVMKRLAPDLIVTQSLCSVCAVSEAELAGTIESLATRPHMVSLEPESLDDVFSAIEQLGRVVGRDASSLVGSLRERVQLVATRSRSLRQRVPMIMLEWLEPPFSAGHWNPELVSLAGGAELLGEEGERSQQVSWEQVSDADPDLIFVACCGYSVERSLEDLSRLSSDRQWGTLRAVSEGRVYVADGSAYFNRPGPRLVDGLEVMANALDPDAHPLPGGLAGAHKVISI